MSIVGTARVTCPGCGTAHACELVQSINTRLAPAAKQRLLRGELNVLACPCGKRTQLVASLLYHDVDANYLCQVCPGGDAAMAKAAEAFRASGATGTQRIVPSLNALLEKVKLLDAGLEDWAIEMAKVLLLATIGGRDLDRVLLFDSVDRAAGERAQPVVRWVLFDEHGGAPVVHASPLAAYTRLVARAHARPGRGELHVDRAWAIDAVRVMITQAS